MNRILKLNLAIYLCASLLTIAHVRGVGGAEGVRTRRWCVTNLHREPIRLVTFFPGGCWCTSRQWHHEVAWYRQSAEHLLLIQLIIYSLMKFNLKHSWKLNDPQPFHFKKLTALINNLKASSSSSSNKMRGRQSVINISSWGEQLLLCTISSEDSQPFTCCGLKLNLPPKT